MEPLLYYPSLQQRNGNVVARRVLQRMNKLSHHWYGLCSQYELQCKNKPKLGQAEFLHSSLSGGGIQDTQENQVIVGKEWGGHTGRESYVLQV
jgi:hypothetical protein